MGLLGGKSGVITGGGRGIAGATASMLAAEGAQVVVGDLGASLDGSGEEASVAQKKADEIKAAGGNAQAFQGDQSNPDETEAMTNKVLDELGPVRILTSFGPQLSRLLVVDRMPEILLRFIDHLHAM